MTKWNALARSPFGRKTHVAAAENGEIRDVACNHHAFDETDWELLGPTNHENHRLCGVCVNYLAQVAGVEAVSRFSVAITDPERYAAALGVDVDAPPTLGVA
ncbi:hypothetical protein ZOD2009_19063 [Haladaptatus paucihalophilus DX253]|uniref:Uncharacterized protein n=1 Tax=Haladaptatus paucihalophilus DX253 TaxID=797209 RepID=E7QYC2_HALPU|nr:hypothetical protein [Haladaptatus paucihalophilus]EFW90447.1 hypothetical protein ZOD2009_19063 [Haladaptatus paucihalophilus DX253]SHL68452.1 hypothetical protein SAMN05444342_4406 [Haladaptatus paucihalophilus DX253]